MAMDCLMCMSRTIVFGVNDQPWNLFVSATQVSYLRYSWRVQRGIQRQSVHASRSCFHPGSPWYRKLTLWPVTLFCLSRTLSFNGVLEFSGTVRRSSNVEEEAVNA